MSIRQDVRDRLAKYTPDCGDNSCRFAQKKGGMRTNGGCRCLSGRSLLTSPPLELLAVAQQQIISELLDELERLEDHKKLSAQIMGDLIEQVDQQHLKLSKRELADEENNG